MPRFKPSPLQHIASARPLLDHQSLTPRTPHTRLGRAEEAQGSYSTQQYEEDDLGTYDLQSEPLLVSSASESFAQSDIQEPIHNRQRRKSAALKSTTIYNFMRLYIGGCLALVLIIIMIASVWHPHLLGKIINSGYMGADSISHMSDTNVISYDNYTQFPLLPSQYAVECHKLMGGFMRHGKYWAESPKDAYHPYQELDGGSNICSGTITYQLGGQVGLLADLGLMAQVAGLARERNKTFLVDDTYWNRGSWMDHFEDVRLLQPGPEPGCTPPSPEELAACPRTARHWIVTARTAQYHLGHGFVGNYVNAYGHELNRLKPIFKTAAESFSETIKPNPENLALIKLAGNELASLAGTGATLEYIGLHLRRGDMHAMSWRYKEGYVPISEYAQAVNATTIRLFADGQANVPVYIASDSPSAQSALIDALPSSTPILSLARSGLRELNEVASRKEYVQEDFNELGDADRVILTRGAVVDFAMISGMWFTADQPAPRATICTLTSSICKLSAIGLGWERAFGEVDDMGNINTTGNGWVEIDNASNIDPVWEAFDLFP